MFTKLNLSTFECRILSVGKAKLDLALWIGLGIDPESERMIVDRFWPSIGRRITGVDEKQSNDARILSVTDC